MGCPFLGQVRMVYCAAFPTKKPLRADRLDVASPCTGDAFEECPFYREARERDRRAAGEGAAGEPAAPPRGGGST